MYPNQFKEVPSNVVYPHLKRQSPLICLPGCLLTTFNLLHCVCMDVCVVSLNNDLSFFFISLLLHTRWFYESEYSVSNDLEPFGLEALPRLLAVAVVVVDEKVKHTQNENELCVHEIPFFAEKQNNGPFCRRGLKIIAN